LNAFMKTLLALLATALLAGCVAVPVEPGPAVYAAPPVVVAPAFGYYRGGPYWRHRYWR
jgi:uncharacterized lipoprotein YajG